MGLDAGRVLKRSVLCPHCNEEYLFTLRTIANRELRCHGCGGSVHLSDRVYGPLLSDVGSALDEIDSAPPSSSLRITNPLFNPQSLLASSLLSNLAAERRPGSSSK
jgi:hypothetical protein